MVTTLVTIPQEQFDALIKGQETIKEMVNTLMEHNGCTQWLESEEARKMLGVSIKTWQNWRDARRIPFSQFGRKIWVNRADIDAFMKSNHIEGRA